MKTRCTRDELLEYINRQIRIKYKSKVEFAAECNKTPQSLNSAMNSASLPSWLIERFGYRKTVAYERVK